MPLILFLDFFFEDFRGLFAIFGDFSQASGLKLLNFGENCRDRRLILEIQALAGLFPPARGFHDVRPALTEGLSDEIGLHAGLFALGSEQIPTDLVTPE